MVFINEWLPNPVGADAEGEWTELWNNGPSLDVSGWTIKTESGSRFVFGNFFMGSGEYALFPRSKTKLSLRNSNGSLYLYDRNFTLVDHAGFMGVAREGQSVGRNGDQFMFLDPTPGEKNASALIYKGDEVGLPWVVSRNLGTSTFWSMMVGTALLITFTFVVIAKRTHALSEPLFLSN